MVLVTEVTLASVDHGDASGIGDGGHLCISDRATRLDHGAHTGGDEHLEAVGEGEEGIRRSGRADGLVARLGHGQVCRHDPRLLSCADTDGLATSGQRHGI